MSGVFPRLSATWLPAAATRLAGDRGIPPWDLVRDTDRALHEFFSRLVPEVVRRDLGDSRSRVNLDLRRLAESARELDASLPQLVESVRVKVDFQFGRLLEGLVAKARARFDRAHPEVARLRHALLPHGRLQERRLAWLDLVARGGAAALPLALAAAEEHLDRALAGEPCHFLLATPGGNLA